MVLTPGSPMLRMRYPTRFQQRSLWNAATGVSILVIGVLLVGLIWLIGAIFGYLQPVLIPLIVAGIIAYLLDPVVLLLERRGMTRLWSVVTVFGAMLVGIALLVAAVLPGIHRSRVALHAFMAQPASASQSATDKLTPSEQKSEDEDRNLVATLAASLHQMRARHRDGLIGWALTETDDHGNPMPAPAVTPKPSAKPEPPSPSATPDPATTPNPGLPPLRSEFLKDPRLLFPTGEMERVPETLDFFWRTRVGRLIDQYKGTITSTAWTWFTAGSSKIMGILGLVIGLIMVPVYLFFFLKDSASIRDHWHDYVPLKASRFKTELVDTLQEINGYLISFFRGQVLVAMIDGVLVGIALEIYDLPYGFLIGIFMAILGVIPYIGNILCLVPACIIAYLHAQGVSPFGLSPWAYTGGVVVIFLVVQQINSLVTAPKIVGDSVGLHPLTVIFSMLFWSLVLGGFVGTLLAVPATAAVKVLFRRFIWERQLREPLTE